MKDKVDSKVTWTFKSMEDESYLLRRGPREEQVCQSNQNLHFGHMKFHMSDKHLSANTK